MKIKHVISTLALAAVTAFGMAVGLKPAENAKEVRAEAGDTWGFAVVFNAATIPESYRDDCNNFRFHCWGSGVDEWFTMHETGVDYLYTANCSFNNSQSVTGGQFKFYQAGSGEKESTDVSFTYGPSSDFFGTMFWNFNGTWEDTKWVPGSQTWGRVQINYYDTNLVSHNEDMTYDAVNHYFHFDNLVIDSNNHFKPIEVLFGSSWDYTYRILLDNEDIFSGDGAWFEVKDEGTYDVYILNYFEEYLGDKGILTVKKHVEENSYIYYVTQSGEESVDYIYSYNSITDTKAFGNWPGKRISKLDNVTEYFGDSGDFKFCGSDGHSFNRRVYKIPVNVGYPADDFIVIHNNNGAQTSNMQVIAHGAYFWDNGSDFINSNDAVALEFLLQVEEVRVGLTAGSVCEMTKSDAITLYTAYLGLTTPQKALVDGSKVWTLKQDKTDGYEDVYYGAIMYRIGIIAEMVSSSGTFSFFDSNTVSPAVIVVILSTITAVAVGVVVITKKRKEN